MLFSWLAEHRRQNILAEPFPSDWLAFLHRDVPHYEFLSDAEQKSLRDHVQIFVAEKTWEGCGGLELTVEMQVSIAAQACLLLLGLEHHDFYKNVDTILVYPTGYKAVQEQPGAVAGLVEAGPSFRLGEAWSRGPVVLSWSDALNGGRNPHDGRNVVMHEFAHKLDLRHGGVADGVPDLPGGQDQYDEWADVMSTEYERLVALHEHGRADVLDEYGATNPAEFFAVSTEAFFEKPRQLREKHPPLYDVLAGFYGQNTAARVEAVLEAERAAAAAAEPDNMPESEAAASPSHPPQAPPQTRRHQRPTAGGHRTLRRGGRSARRVVPGPRAR